MPEIFLETLAFYRSLVLKRIIDLIPKNRYRSTLYDPMLEYPLREGKGLRPALCLSVCRACGGSLEEGIDSAAALEMFHNAFLLHDDIADRSEYRRGLPTLHTQYGIGVATNVGDALNMLALRTLLGNVAKLGPERALTILQEVERMTRETAEGQSLDLAWTAHRNLADLRVRDYLLMIHKKTCWYTCIAPLRIGGLIARVPREQLESFNAFGARIGAAFQIQDDILNLTADVQLYGKEIGGDLAEGKITLMVAHLLQRASPQDHRRILRIFAKERPRKTRGELQLVFSKMQEHRSLDFAADVARRLTLRAQHIFETHLRWIPASPHRRFLEGMIDFMIERSL
ncbi:MAG: polyprenyl synthetase family protein [Thermoanaerobaculia bacterium]